VAARKNKMKLTKSKLKEIIREELNEAFGQLNVKELVSQLKKSSSDNPVWVEIRGNAYMIKKVKVDKKRNMTFIQVQ
jgi:sugar phosphate isomerase/epimerase